MRQLLKNIRVFEVDYGPTREYKKRRVQEIFRILPLMSAMSRLTTRARGSGYMLVKAGYRSDRMTFFIWEGVTITFRKRLSVAHCALSRVSRLHGIRRARWEAEIVH